MTNAPLRVTLLLTALAVLAGCGRAPVATPVPPTALPEGAVTLEQTQVDLDLDGSAERVTVFQHGERVGVVVEPSGGQLWGAGLPPGVAFVGLKTQDLTADRAPELLIELQGPGEDERSLCLIRWAGGQGQVLSPQGGPLEGKTCFVSRHYPPLVDDLNTDSAWEVAVSVDRGDPHFLFTVVYEWDGQVYRESDLYLVPPRVMPTRSP